MQGCRASSRMISGTQTQNLDEHKTLASRFVGLLGGFTLTASPFSWTCASFLIHMRCGALFLSLVHTVCCGILGLGLQGIVMVDKGKGS